MRHRNAVLESLELFREQSPNIWVSNMLAFLYVCENEGINVKELAQVCRFNEATASRSIRSLAEKDTPGALPPALGLIELVQNPQDGRGRLLRLTEKGRRLRDELDGIIRAGHPILLPG